MRILITGGNGYVGRTLTRLLYPHHDVVVLDCLRQSEFRMCSEELDHFQLKKIDIRDTGAVRGVFQEFQPEIVIHLAAIHFIPECDAKPQEAASINTLGTVELLDAALPESRFVLISTAAVYAPEDRRRQEDSSPLSPVDVYGFTKLHAEQYLRLWAQKKSLDARIVRLFNVVGPGETNPHLLPAILAQVLKGNRVLRLGNCHPKRDYIHVSDAAAGIAAVALGEPNGHAVEAVNIGTGSPYSVYEVVETLSEVIGEELRIEVDPARVRASDNPFLSADIQKACTRFGWKPQMELIDSLRDLWSNPDIPKELLDRS